MSTNLQELFPIHHLSVLENSPDISIGGFVFVMPHFDGLESYAYFSINHQSESGTGWQSQRVYDEQQAIQAAAILAEFLDAEFCL